MEELNSLNKKERKLLYKSMTSNERKALILKKMKLKGIDIGSGVPHKNYDKEEVFDLIKIANCFPELREKNNKNREIN